MKITRDMYDDLEADDYELYDDYSGRGMFGAQCLALVGDVGALLRFVDAIRQTAADASGESYAIDIVEAMVSDARSDAMGTGPERVYYFPEVKVE